MKIESRQTRAVRALLGLVLLTSFACPREHIAHYRCRGVVRAVVGTGPDARVAIQHEALPAFVDRDGKVAPMSSMTMIFGLAPELTPEALHVNQKVSFEFAVTWQESPFLTVTRLHVLPPETELALPAPRVDR